MTRDEKLLHTVERTIKSLSVKIKENPEKFSAEKLTAYAKVINAYDRMRRVMASTEYFDDTAQP